MSDVIPDSHLDLLEGAGFLHLASIGPDGEPQSHPVWYQLEDGLVKVSTTKDRQKFRNIERDPRVAGTVLDADNPYRYLEVRGRVAKIEEDPEQAFIDVLAKRYLGEDEYPYKQPGDERVVLYIDPDHAVANG